MESPDSGKFSANSMYKAMTQPDMPLDNKRKYGI
jgi:hypothetical protein